MLLDCLGKNGRTEFRYTKTYGIIGKRHPNAATS
jgi:hypothetical protein